MRRKKRVDKTEPVKTEPVKTALFLYITLDSSFREASII